MELRLLVAPEERRIFIERMSQARAMRNGGFRDTPRARITEIHVQFGRMYALFDEAGPHPEQMIGGFIMHDLASFGQTYFVPDFSKYPPQTAFEIGEMWAFAKGAGTWAQRGAVILLGLFQANAVVGYAIVKPWDLTKFYGDLVPTGEPIEWPYAKTVDGGPVHCQAMVSEGDHLRRWISRVWATGFETFDNHRRVRFPQNVGEVTERDDELIITPQPIAEKTVTNGAQTARVEEGATAS